MSLNCKKVTFAISCLIFFIIIFAMVIFITTYALLSKSNKVRNEVKMIPIKNKNFSNAGRSAQQASATNLVDASGLISLLQKLLSLLNINTQSKTTKMPIQVTEWQRPVVTPLPPSRPMIHNWFRTTTNKPLPFDKISRCGLADHVSKVERVFPGLIQSSNLEWMASIQSGCSRRNENRRHVCGGVLVTDQHVVTAASCLQRLRCPRVVIGANDINKARSSNVFTIQKILVHPLKSVHVFSFQNLKYQSHLPDLAIVKLDRKTNLMPICLPDVQHEKYVYHYFDFAGWGQNHLTRRSRYTRELINVRIDNLDCKNANKALNVNSNNFLCIRHTLKGGKVCSNDEGGPLMYKVNGVWYAYGILFKRLIERRVDWINPRCEYNNIGFSVYTKFFDHLYWIRNNLN